MFSEKITNIKSLKLVAQRLLDQFPGHRIFAFYGKMGAGKTTFIQALCDALGSDDNVTSPTFALINEYSTPNLISIFHFDFYRIKDIEEAFDLGYEDYFYSNNFCLIEWPEMIEPLLPEKIVKVKIEVSDDETRTVSAEII